MVAVTFIGFDPDSPFGQRILSPAVRAEISQIAPSTVNDGDITTAKLADGAVTKAKLSNQSVSAEKIVNDTITAAQIAEKAVGTAELADQSVTGVKAGLGTVTAKDANGNFTNIKIIPMTIQQYSALGTNIDPNAMYCLYD